MLFKSSAIAAFAATAALAAPAERNDKHDIVVRLTGDGVRTWDAVGFSPSTALEATSARNPGPFSNVQLFFSEKIKKEIPGIETRYRCALEDEDGNRIITTRGQNIDFNFGDNNNPNSWTLKDGPFANVKVKCDPNFVKVDPRDVNTVRVVLSDGAEFGRQTAFSAEQVEAPITENIAGDFSTVRLIVGPGVENQKLRCQVKDEEGNVILVDRGNNKNKETFGDGGKLEWQLDAAGDKVASVDTVTCSPEFK